MDSYEYEYDDTLVEKYLEQNDVTFELRAINGDGDVLAKYSDQTSASGVAGFAELLDNDIEQLAYESEQDRLEQDAEIQLDIIRGK